MGNRLKNKVAVVIGAARGIGAGIAERFIEEGASVLIADVEDSAGKATAGSTASVRLSTWTARSARRLLRSGP